MEKKVQDIIPNYSKKKSMWESVSNKVSDWAEEKLLEDDSFFIDKYGKDWRSKKERQRQVVRSLWGTLPQDSKAAKRDAIISALSLVPAFSSIRLGRSIAGRQKLLRGVTGGSIKDFTRKKRIMGSKGSDDATFTSESPLIGSGYMESKQLGKIAEEHIAGMRPAPDWFFNDPTRGKGLLMEFDVPYSYMMEEAVGGAAWRNFGRISGGRLIPGAREVEFGKGILTDFLTNVHKAGSFRRGSLPERGWEDLTDAMRWRY
tara:strand:+ start:48 stop:824 length:777 start_codon:yes stop_codon:yes gene_type:complete